MLRLARYFKPYIPMFLLAIGLLFIQAMTDLALPNYLSYIVNTGIQQNGIENALPDAIRQSQMDRLALFLSPEDAARVLDAYTLVTPGTTAAAELAKQVPAAADQPVYTLKQLDASQISALNPVVGKALLAVSALEKAIADPSSLPESAGIPGLDLANLPAGTDIFTVLANLPEAQRAAMRAAFEQQFAALNDSLIVQSAVNVVRAEYTALGMDTARIQSSYILNTGLKMLLVSLLGVICAIAVGYYASKSAAGLARDLRRAVFEKVEHFSGAELDRFSTASLITRSTNDINQIQMVVLMMVRMVFYAPIMGVGGLIRAVDTAPSMWWIIALAVGVLIIMVSTVFRISLPKFKIIQKLIDRLNLVTRESLAGMMVIRAFNMQPVEEKRFERANRELTDTSLFVNRVMVFMMPAMMFIMSGLSLLIIWIGAQQVAQARIQVGDMMAFMQYATQIVFSFLMMSFMFIMLPRAEVSADRIAEVLETDPVIKDPEQPRHFSGNFLGEVEFRDVSFRYPGAEEDVLCGVSFTAKPGQTTAFIGSTGSGKSTIVNLIPRFYDVTGGQILIDGVDIRQVSQHDLRDKIGYIPQKSSLFSGTIESNLRYAIQDASEETLREAAEISQAAEFIDSKPEGLQTEIAQGGANVSGGQKQRLSIARALVKRAPIYIFDDSFSALDFKTDAALRKALKEKTAASTLMIVTQRVATVRNAEQIIVLDDGQVAGIGTHEELMETCETYREIALSQFSVEELA